MHALIATDGSEIAVEAAKTAGKLLAMTRITLLTVADTILAEDSGEGGIEGNLLTPEEAEKERAAILSEGRSELDDTIALMGLDPAIVERKLVEGSAGQMICKEAHDLGVDVVVIGSHGKGAFKRLMIGSISEYVLHHSPAPVLVVRLGERDSWPPS